MWADRTVLATVPADGGDFLHRLALALTQGAQLEPQIGNRESLLPCPPQPLPLLPWLERRKQDVVAPA